MAHSNKPQPEAYDGENPYGSYEDQCRDYAERYFADPDSAAREELEVEWGARYDQFDGFDRFDAELEARYAREDEEDAALYPEYAVTAPAAAPSVPVLLPPALSDGDDILF